jgi:hypothetical protein
MSAFRSITRFLSGTKVDPVAEARDPRPGVFGSGSIIELSMAPEHRAMRVQGEQEHL